MATLATSMSTARHDLGRALIVTRREVRDMSRDWRIIAPIIILTLVFPPLMNFTAGSALRFAQRYGSPILAERTFPFLLMVVGFFPISISLVIALETFVGEKERRSLEPLLSTPLTNLQLYIGKTLAAMLPPLIGSYLGIVVYLVSLYLNVGWLPPLNLLVLIVTLTTVQGVVMVAGAVVVSSQTTSVRAANLLASFIIVPMAMLVQLEALVMFWARYNLLWVIIGGLLATNVLLVRMGVRIFNREELLGRDIDQLNLKVAAVTWWRLVRGLPQAAGATSAGLVARAWGWYRREVLAVIPRLRAHAIVVLLAMAWAVYLGAQKSEVWVLPAQTFAPDEWFGRFGRAVETIGLLGTRGVLLILWQNVRVLAISSLLGVFTLGVLSIIIAMAPLGIIGYIGGTVYGSPIPPEVFWASLLPHAVAELPAIVLGTAAALRLGASVIAPPPGKTVTEGWLMALADLVKLWVGFLLPLLVVAAVLEVYLTPRIVLSLAGG